MFSECEKGERGKEVRLEKYSVKYIFIILIQTEVNALQELWLRVIQLNAEKYLNYLE